MNRLTSFPVAAIAALFSQGCTTTFQPAPTAFTATMVPTALGSSRIAPAEVMRLAQKTEVAAEKDAPPVPGHPLTSVVVTQCNLIVAAYVTMPDGKLLRFDQRAAVPAEQLMEMAYAATRSERVEVACDDAGGAAVGFEKHEPL